MMLERLGPVLTLGVLLAMCCATPTLAGTMIFRCSLVSSAVDGSDKLDLFVDTEQRAVEIHNEYGYTIYDYKDGRASPIDQTRPDMIKTGKDYVSISTAKIEFGSSRQPENDRQYINLTTSRFYYSGGRSIYACNVAK